MAVKEDEGDMLEDEVTDSMHQIDPSVGGFDKFKILFDKDRTLDKKRGIFFVILIYIGLFYAMCGSIFKIQDMRPFNFTDVVSVYNSSNTNYYSLAIPASVASEPVISSRDFLDLPAYKG